MFQWELLLLLSDMTCISSCPKMASPDMSIRSVREADPTIFTVQNCGKCKRNNSQSKAVSLHVSPRSCTDFILAEALLLKSNFTCSNIGTIFNHRKEFVYMTGAVNSSSAALSTTTNTNRCVLKQFISCWYDKRYWRYFGELANLFCPAVMRAFVTSRLGYYVALY